MRPEYGRSVAASRVGFARTELDPAPLPRLGPPRLAVPAPPLHTRRHMLSHRGLSPAALKSAPPCGRAAHRVGPARRIPVHREILLRPSSSPGKFPRAFPLGRFPSEPTPPRGLRFPLHGRASALKTGRWQAGKAWGPPGVRLSCPSHPPPRRRFPGQSVAGRDRCPFSRRPVRTPDPGRVWSGPSGDGRRPHRRTADACRAAWERLGGSAERSAPRGTLGRPAGPPDRPLRGPLFVERTPTPVRATELRGLARRR